MAKGDRNNIAMVSNISFRIMKFCFLNMMGRNTIAALFYHVKCKITLNAQLHENTPLSHSVNPSAKQKQ